MKNLFKTAALGALALAASFATPSTADAQEAILAEIYGRGVHAFYSGQHQQAHSLFPARSMVARRIRELTTSAELLRP